MEADVCVFRFASGSAWRHSSAAPNGWPQILWIDALATVAATPQVIFLHQEEGLLKPASRSPQPRPASILFHLFGAAIQRQNADPAKTPAMQKPASICVHLRPCLQRARRFAQAETQMNADGRGSCGSMLLRPPPRHRK